MRTTRLLLMLIMIMTGLGSYAQKTVTFTAGTDCGKNSSYKRLSNVSEVLSKDGVTIKASNATFNAGATYSAKKNIVTDGTVTVTSTDYKILSVLFTDADNAAALSADGFDAATATWTGEANEVKFTIKSGETKFSSVVVTLASQANTSLAFAEQGVRVVSGETATLPALTLTSNGAEVTGKAYTYESSDESVVSVDATSGELTVCGEGKADITASFAGDTDYAGASATIHVYVLATDVVLFESFDKMTGRGGNDGEWDFTSTNNAFSSDGCDLDGWESSAFVYNANGCLRIERASSATTPAIGVNGDIELTFKAGAIRNTNAVVSISVEGDGTADVSEVTTENGQFDTYTVKVTGVSEDTRIKFASNTTIFDGAGFFIDEVTVRDVTVPTAIDGIKAPTTSVKSGIYTTDGTYLGTDSSRLAKGLYIIGGKKVIKK